MRCVPFAGRRCAHRALTPSDVTWQVAAQSGQYIKYQCKKGQCGTCEVRVDGKWIRTCVSQARHRARHRAPLYRAPQRAACRASRPKASLPPLPPLPSAGALRRAGPDVQGAGQELDEASEVVVALLLLPVRQRSSAPAARTAHAPGTRPRSEAHAQPDPFWRVQLHLRRDEEQHHGHDRLRARGAQVAGQVPPTCASVATTTRARPGPRCRPRAPALAPLTPPPCLVPCTSMPTGSMSPYISPISPLD